MQKASTNIRVVFAVLIPFALLIGGCRQQGIQTSSGAPSLTLPDNTQGTLTPGASGDYSFDFGSVPVGQTRTATLNLADIGAGVLNVIKVDAPADAEFTVDLAEGTSIGSQAQSVPVHFLPFGAGVKTSSFVIHTDSNGTPSVTVTLTGTGVDLDLEVVPQAVDFGKVIIHTEATQQIQLTNKSALPLNLTFTAVNGPNASLFSQQGTATMLAPGAVLKLNVTYGPNTAGQQPDTSYFTINSCAGCPATTINMRGQGVATGLSVTPDPLNFGYVPLPPPGVTNPPGVTQNITISNIANRTLEVQAWHFLGGGAGVFTVPPTPGMEIDVQPGGTTTIPVNFIPSGIQSEPFTDSLQISSNDPSQPTVTVPVSGQGGGATISCTPTSLAFGQVSVGVPSTLRLICSNIGQDVLDNNGNPIQAAELQLSGTNLSIPNSTVFSATIDSSSIAASPCVATDGGAAPAQVCLSSSSPGAFIDVTYAPTAATNDSANLLLTSNDAINAQLTIPLSGTGLTLPPCDFAIQPASLVFGHVDVGSPAQLAFSIVNNGNAECLVNGLAPLPSSAPEFSLVNGPMPSAIIQPAGNPTSAPNYLQVIVQFAPDKVASFSGDIGFSISNPTTPQQAVHLSGSSQPGCLVVTPENLDFGTVGYNTMSSQWCTSQKRSFQAFNTCSYDVHIQSISLNPGTDAQPDFALSGTPAAYPVDVPPGSSPVTFQVEFVPQSQGPKLGSLSIQTVELTDPYLVTFKGDAEPNGQQIDTFQGHPPKVDLLWIADSDDDLQERTEVSTEVPAFVGDAVQQGIDFQMAVTTSDVCRGPTAENGQMVPCPGCKINGTAPTIVTANSAPDPATALSTLLLLGNTDTDSCFGIGVNGRADEQFFESVYEALQPSMLAGFNTGFLRDDAYLSVITINGDEEDDLSPHNVNFYYNFFESVKGVRNSDLFSFSYINPSYSQGGNGQSLLSTLLAESPNIGTMIQQTGGLALDTTQANWWKALENLWTIVINAHSRYQLTAQPVVNTIQVSFNGSPFPQMGTGGITLWSYDPASNAIIFNPSAAPQNGDVITVTYTVACGA